MTRKEYNRQLGERIRYLRTRMGLTQSLLVKAFNSTAPHCLQTTVKDVSKYEKGINVIPGDKLRKLQSIIGS
jgi:transcriptional regulator with XRE-family HTH domain